MSLTLAPLFLLAMCCVGTSSAVATLAASSGGLDCNSLSDWMACLPAAVRVGRSIAQLVVPGSHDSATHVLNVSATPPMQDELYQVLLDVSLDPLTKPLVRDPIQDLTLTQRNAIGEQLECGIRSLDLRVLYNNASSSDDPEEAFYFSHSFAAVPMIATLRNVSAFLSAHPGEVLFITLAPDWEHREQTDPYMNAVLSHVTSILGAWLVAPPSSSSCSASSSSRPGADPQHQHQQHQQQQQSVFNFTTFTSVSLQTLVDANKRIFLECDGSFSTTQFPNVWTSGTLISSFWPNGQTVNESVSAIEAYLPTMPTVNMSKTLNLVFFTITPDEDSIIANVLSHLGNLTNMTSLRTYAEAMRPPTMSILQRSFTAEPQQIVNIVSIDWPTNALTQFIVDLNLFPQ